MVTQRYMGRRGRGGVARCVGCKGEGGREGEGVGAASFAGRVSFVRVYCAVLCCVVLCCVVLCCVVLCCVVLCCDVM